jgi:cytochrome c-type biogenesis protein
MPVPAAISADPAGVLIAFGAGILSFVSPCVLPLVPGYVSMVSGLSAAELEAGGDGATPSAALRPVLRGIGLFVAGFTVVFVALGATASSFGRLLSAHEVALAHLSGAVIILLGVVMLLAALPARVWAHAGVGTVGVVSRVTGERRFDVRPSRLGVWAAPLMGMAFAFAWTPCVGPVLGVVLGLAAHNGTLPGGVLLLFAYSLGLAVPFVLVGVAFGRLTAALNRARPWLWAVELLAGLVLVVFGVLLLTDNVSWVSTQFSDLLNDLGLSRLSRS